MPFSTDFFFHQIFYRLFPLYYSSGVLSFFFILPQIFFPRVNKGKENKRIFPHFSFFFILDCFSILFFLIFCLVLFKWYVFSTFPLCFPSLMITNARKTSSYFTFPFIIFEGCVPRKYVLLFIYFFHPSNVSNEKGEEPRLFYSLTSFCL